MEKWHIYVKNLLCEIKKFPNTAIVGISGSYKKRNNHIRVYINGGRVLTINLDNENIYFGESYLDKDNHIQKYLYLNNDEQECVKDIIKCFKVDPYVFEENRYKKLHEYLNCMSKATYAKYGHLKNSVNNTKRERCYQAMLYQKLYDRSRREYVFFDFEFQSIAEMNYSESEIEEWRSKYGNIKKMHNGKPDYIAINENGFLIIELKTNKKACGGNAGLEEHNDDNYKLVQINKGNHILVKELKQRLSVMVEYGLIHADYVGMANNILSMDDDRVLLDVRYLFIENEDFTLDMCNSIIENLKLDKSKCIIEKID